jgi:hypothetical protein
VPRVRALLGPGAGIAALCARRFRYLRGKANLTEISLLVCHACSCSRNIEGRDGLPGADNADDVTHSGDRCLASASQDGAVAVVCHTLPVWRPRATSPLPPMARLILQYFLNKNRRDIGKSQSTSACRAWTIAGTVVVWAPHTLLAEAASPSAFKAQALATLEAPAESQLPRRRRRRRRQQQPRSVGGRGDQAAAVTPTAVRSAVMPAIDHDDVNRSSD